MAFWDCTGKQVGTDKQIGFDPVSISFFDNENFFALSGNNKKVGLWSRDGSFLADICEKKDWVLCTKVDNRLQIS